MWESAKKKDFYCGWINVFRMDSSQLATLTSSWGSTTRSLRSPQMARDYRWSKLSYVFHQYALEFVWYSSSSVNHVCYVGDCLLCHAALIRCEEALREDHAFSHMGGSEGRRFCTRNGPSRGGASQPKSWQALGETGKEPHQGTYI